VSAAGSREHDLVLVGATGFVGRLTARHLARYAPAGTRIALAGRSPERLEALRSDLGGTAARWPLVTLDVAEEAGLAALARSTRVVLTTVGPYLRYGVPLVSACAEAGTDYADLTAEALFVRRAVDTGHASARRSGSRIVHACGFDSVPSDLGVGLCAARAAAEGEGQLTASVLHVRSMRGGFSGGTVDSLRQQLLEVRLQPSARAVLGRADALLDSPPGPGGRRSGHLALPGRDRPGGRWHAPYLLGVFNTQIVHRTDALLGGAYATTFRHREVIDTGRGVAGAAGAAAVAGGTAALVAGLWFAPTRAVLDRVLPAPGAGPSERLLERGRFCVEVLATTTTGARYRTRVAADIDPGYAGTAAMLGEAGLSLAFDELPGRSGVLTPWVAFGQRLAARLRTQGFTVQTDRL